MRNDSEIINIITSCEFDCMGQCAASDVQVNSLVRESCAANTCSAYNTNWACPPACGDLEYFQGQIATRSVCYLVQTVGELEDSFDIEGMMQAEEVHKKRVQKLNDLVKEAYPEALVLSAGTCTICSTCTYPDEPCRFPDKRLVSMEAAGIWVSDLCQRAEIPYNHGSNTIAYTSCVLV